MEIKRQAGTLYQCSYESKEKTATLHLVSPAAAFDTTSSGPEEKVPVVPKPC